MYKSLSWFYIINSIVIILVITTLVIAIIIIKLFIIIIILYTSTPNYICSGSNSVLKRLNTAYIEYIYFM